tara:strand:+ start:653 stop:1354 length:702 start_codon:yes stop_codon:yes gene_type:complete
MGLTNNFEKRLFFAIGRHIWNIIGVSGFVSVLAGFILFVNSYSNAELKTRDQYLGKSYSTKLKSKKEFFGKNFVDYEIEKQALIDSGKLVNYTTWEKTFKNKENGYKGYWNWGWGLDSGDYGTDDIGDAHIIYKKQQYDKYVNKSLDSNLLLSLDSQNKEYLIYKNNFLTRKKDMENRYEKYKNNFYSSQNMKSVQRTTSIIPITYGFGVLSVSSVFSAIFSIERNTRKDKSD